MRKGSITLQPAADRTPSGCLPLAYTLAVSFLFCAAIAAPAEITGEGRWKDVGNGVLADARTGLQWTKNDNGGELDWNDANSYCNGKRNGWRLPSVEELTALYDEAAGGTRVVLRRCARSHRNFNLTGSWFWSATQVGRTRPTALNWRGACSWSTARGLKQSEKPPTEPGRSVCEVLDLTIDFFSRSDSWNHRGFSHPVAPLEQIHGNVLMDRADLTQSSVSVTLPLGGLRAGDDHLDKRLRGAEFFDAARYPEDPGSRAPRSNRQAPTRSRLRGDLVAVAWRNEVSGSRCHNQQDQRQCRRQADCRL